MGFLHLLLTLLTNTLEQSGQMHIDLFGIIFVNIRKFTAKIMN